MMAMRKINRGIRSGFTLIELLLVLVILAVLAAVVVPKFTGRSEQAKQAAAKTDISNISMQINAFEIDTGRYPSTEEGLGALMSAPANVNGWRGPYLERVPQDPYGSPYQYRYPGQHNTSSFDLFSLGADQREGNDDIDNWSGGGGK
jgi:general secretion pathway protein G